MIALMTERTPASMTEMSAFAQWLLKAQDRAGLSATRVAELAGLDRSYINRLLNSHKDEYRYYKRPGYDKTLAIGKAVCDIEGAMAAADRLDEYRERNPRPSTERADSSEPLKTIVREVGHDYAALSPGDQTDLREGVNAFVQTLLNRRKKTPELPMTLEMPVDSRQLENHARQQADFLHHAAADGTSQTLRERQAASRATILWTLDLEGRFRLSLGEGLARVGLRPYEVLGKFVWDVYAAEPEFLDKVRLALASDAPLTWEARLGEQVFACRTAPIRDAEGCKFAVAGASLLIEQAETS